MPLEGVDASARAFIRGAWPLCLIAILNLWCLMPTAHPYAVFSFLYGFAGCLIFVRGFGAVQRCACVKLRLIIRK